MHMPETSHGIRKEILPNGLAVLTESMENVHSVSSVGIWLRTGSRREHAAVNGIAHFIEHMVFKGTRRAVGGGHRARSGSRFGRDA